MKYLLCVKHCIRSWGYRKKTKPINFAALGEMGLAIVIGDSKLNKIYNLCRNEFSFCKEGNGKLLEGSK